MADFKTTVTWAEVKKQFLHVVEHGKWKQGDGYANDNSTYINRWHRQEREHAGWSGASSNDTVKYLREGFHSKDLQVLDLEGPPRRHTRPAYGEDSGEVSVSRLTGGYDSYYLERAEREGRPGMTIECEFGFSAGTQAATITKYGAWIASLIAALEARGYDLTVTINFTVTALFKKVRTSQRQTVRILVKRPNEVSDFASWSALFSPAGYRHLVFCGVLVAGDNLESTVSGSLGHCVRSQWDVKLTDGVIHVTGDAMGSTHRGFDPTDTLTTAAKREGIL